MLSVTNLRRTIRVLAVLPLVAGALTLVFGSAVIPGRGSPGANVESELHFYGAWWIGAGVFLLSIAPGSSSAAASCWSSARCCGSPPPAG